MFRFLLHVPLFRTLCAHLSFRFVHKSQRSRRHSSFFGLSTLLTKIIPVFIVDYE